MDRISDDLGSKIQEIIRSMKILEVVRGRIKWEVFPLLGPDPANPRQPTVFWMIGIGVRVPLLDDHVVNYEMVPDPYDHAQVRYVVNKLYETSQAEADEKKNAAATGSNGHRSPGGLITP